MVMHTVYDAAGKAHVVEPIDAKEYVKSGHYFRDPPAPAPVADAEVAPVAPPAVEEDGAKKPKKQAA